MWGYDNYMYPMMKLCIFDNDNRTFNNRRPQFSNKDTHGTEMMLAIAIALSCLGLLKKSSALSLHLTGPEKQLP